MFSASELPGFYPIPAHNEMSFTAHPPDHIFFACTIEPEKFGETPLVDFRGVWRDLDPALREAASDGGFAGPHQSDQHDAAAGQGQVDRDVRNLGGHGFGP